MSQYILEFHNVTKEFPGVKALDSVNMNVEQGHIHGLVGENGAGKSTLMKILSGVYAKGTYTGEIRIDGKLVAFKNIKDSEKAGISIIYQELMMVPDISIAENIFLGRFGAIIKWDKINSDAKKWMEQVGLDESPTTLVKDIGIGKQQLVEIAKALSLNARLLILDEPTAALTEKEVNHLLEKLHEIKDKGVTCIYISHKLEEVLAICDEVTILRDGVTVSSHRIDELDEKKMISKMVGRDFSNRFPPKVECAQDEIAFEVRSINLLNYDNPDIYILKDINFKVNYGEILGIAGLMGAGRTELVNSLFGDFKGRLSGEIFVCGKKVSIKSPEDAISNGLGLVTEDRKYNGLNIIDTIENNIMMVSIDQFCKFGVINKNKATKECDGISKRIKIKATSLETLVMNLSGGNQQKVVLAKWLMMCPRVLIIDEPTRGIDVGAKYEIYTLMNELKRQGIAIIMVSSELPEIIGMSDRITVLKEGQITGEFYNQDVSEELIMERAMGGTKK
jgi:D-xylose transport system ATP-binding protein